MGFRRAGKHFVEVDVLNHLNQPERRTYDIRNEIGLASIKAAGGDGAFELANQMLRGEPPKPTRMAGEKLKQTPMTTATPKRSTPPIVRRSNLILPTRLSTADLSDEVIVDLYNRSRVQSTGQNTFHHPGEEFGPANMDNRFFGSNLLAELVAMKLKESGLAPNAISEIRSRPTELLDYFSDSAFGSGGDISGLPKGKAIDVKYVGGNKPSNVTKRVGNELRTAVDRGENPIVSHYQMKQGFIANDEIATLQSALNRFHEKPQLFELRGNLTGTDMLQHGTMQVLPGLDEPRLAVPFDHPHGTQQMIIDYLKG